MERFKESKNRETDENCSEPLPADRGFYESILAVEAVKYPQLHAIMVTLQAP